MATFSGNFLQFFEGEGKEEEDYCWKRNGGLWTERDPIFDLGTRIHAQKYTCT